MTTKPLWKTTIVIWSEYDSDTVELTDLAREAESGDAYCSYNNSELVADPFSDPHAPSQEFFYDPDDEDDE